MESYLAPEGTKTSVGVRVHFENGMQAVVHYLRDAMDAHLGIQKAYGLALIHQFDFDLRTGVRELDRILMPVRAVDPLALRLCYLSSLFYEGYIDRNDLRRLFDGVNAESVTLIGNPEPLTLEVRTALMHLATLTQHDKVTRGVPSWVGPVRDKIELGEIDVEYLDRYLSTVDPRGA